MKLSLFFNLLIFLSFGNLIGQCADDPYVEVSNQSLGTNHFCNLNTYDGPMIISSCSSIPGNDWILVIDDEFNGPDLDLTLWNPQLPWGNQAVNQTPHLINLHIPQNISFSNGFLKLRGKYDSNPLTTYPVWKDGLYIGNQHYDYTSGCVSSKINFPINSRIQIKCKAFPESRNNWSALWLIGDNEQEIDILELTDATGSQYDNGVSDYWQKMTYHSREYGQNAPATAEAVQKPYSYNNLTINANQYDLIWDKYKIQWYFNSNVVHQITQFHYIPSTWPLPYIKKHFRKYPIPSYIAMVPRLGERFVVNPYYPDGTSMKLIMDFDIQQGTTTNYTANKTMDIDYAKVWLRANCQSNYVVNQVNYVYEEFYNGTTNKGTTFELGGYITTNPNNSITILNNHHCFYVATNEIALLNGFGAEDNSYFSAYISTCEHAWSLRTSNEDSILDKEDDFDFNNLENLDSDEISISYNNNKVELKSSQNLIISYELYDVTGKIILQQDVNEIFFEIQNENFAKGIYLLKIIKQHEISYKKIFL